MASTIETYLGEAKKHRKNLEALVAKLEHAENDGAAERVRGHPVQLRRSRGLAGPAAPPEYCYDYSAVFLLFCCS